MKQANENNLQSENHIFILKQFKLGIWHVDQELFLFSFGPPRFHILHGQCIYDWKSQENKKKSEEYLNKKWKAYKHIVCVGYHYSHPTDSKSRFFQIHVVIVWTNFDGNSISF